MKKEDQSQTLPPQLRSELAVYKMCLQQQGYARSSVRNYGNAFRRFLLSIQPQMPADLSDAEMQSSVEAMSSGKSNGMAKVISGAVQLYYTKVLRRKVA